MREAEGFEGIEGELEAAGSELQLAASAGDGGDGDADAVADGALAFAGGEALDDGPPFAEGLDFGGGEQVCQEHFDVLGVVEGGDDGKQVSGDAGLGQGLLRGMCSIVLVHQVLVAVHGCSVNPLFSSTCDVASILLLDDST